MAMAAADAELQLSFLPSETLVWQQGPAIGTGRFGHVVLALRIPSAELLAVKQVFIQEECKQGNDTSSLCMQRVVPLAKIQREVEIVQSIQHPNVVQCLGCERYGPMYRIFMEFIPAGSLSKLLKELGPFPESAARHFIRQLTEGVAYLHHVGIAHRDLKCANLMLTDDGTVKIADFGSATMSVTGTDPNDGDIPYEDEFANKHETARSVRDGLGSPYWMAPELVRAERGEDGWRKADVWGIGCVLIELVTGKPPWENHSNPLTAMFHIASKDSIPSIPSTLSASARSFLLCCFIKDPAARPSARDLLTHPFLTGQAGALGDWRPQMAVHGSEPCNNQNRSNAELIDADTKGNEPITLQRQDSDVPASITNSRSRSGSEASLGSSANAEEEEEGNIAYSSDDGSDGEAPAVVQQQADTLDSVASGSRRPSATSFAWREIGRVRALADYTAGDTNELSLKEGRTLVVSGVNEFGWWRGRHAVEETTEGATMASETGWFPCTYVEWIEGTRPFKVIRNHSTDEGASTSEELSLSIGDKVNVIHCEWRDDRLWAFGSAVTGGRQGWFPFASVIDTND